MFVRIFKDIPETIDVDLFGEIYEFFLGEFAIQEGKDGGTFYTPSTVVRYMVEVMKAPGNESLVTGFMAGGAEGGNDMFATYSAGIGDEMAKMTTDETVEWLYKLFFRERAVKEIKPQDDYLPTIIYEAEKEHTVLKGFIFVVVILCVGELIFLKNRAKIERFIEDQKFRKKKKEEFEHKTEQEAK